MSTTRYVVAGSFIDGISDEVRRKVYLAIWDCRIAAIGQAAELGRAEMAGADDLSHCTIVPPLVDCSVSLLRLPSLASRKSSAEQLLLLEQKKELLQRHTAYCVAHGVLGLADGDDFLGLEDEIEKTMRQQGMIAFRRGQLPQDHEAEKSGGFSAGSGFIKIYFSADIEGECGPLSPATYQELCTILGNKHAKKAVVVANGREQVARALAAGADAIEQGYGMGEDNLKEMAHQGVLWIPSILRAKNSLDGAGSGGDICCRFSQRYAAPGKALPGAEQYWKKVLAEQLTQLRLAKKLGVKVAVGSGAGCTGILHGESVVEEMKLFLKAGYSLTQAIRCASVNGAAFFAMADLGGLTVGNKAAFLVTRGTPQLLPRKLSYLENIYIDGSPSRHYRKNPVKSS